MFTPMLGLGFVDDTSQLFSEYIGIQNKVTAWGEKKDVNTLKDCVNQKISPPTFDHRSLQLKTGVYTNKPGV